ncbi:hypothetical protein Pla52o_53660 [Novipirellula galeiformis]|uniref:Carboxypeptidase regulatory-like domain-containing protein n=1 Tax=Novipirellula galeiformis TaxID=2528004 RepID=A0A5C6C0M8_9BACT|nr:carboxypeptidase-like regulatory domain-containing protein [Novipirellula galeiformis]TWU17191.1 hypothetical protein Pla52o_53660 [Novipirellula galeiformis]
MQRLNLMHVLLLAGIASLVGCGTDAGLDGTIPAAGTVTWQGQPVEGAVVAFIPTDGSRPASGRTDASGQFELTTLKANDGAMPGSYTVTISKSEVDGTEMSSEEARAYFEKHGQPPTVSKKELLPVKYKRPDQSGLTAEVSVSGENQFPFDLTE